MCVFVRKLFLKIIILHLSVPDLHNALSTAPNKLVAFISSAFIYECQKCTW